MAEEPGEASEYFSIKFSEGEDGEPKILIEKSERDEYRVTIEEGDVTVEMNTPESRPTENVSNRPTEALNSSEENKDKAVILNRKETEKEASSGNSGAPSETRKRPRKSPTTKPQNRRRKTSPTESRKERRKRRNASKNRKRPSALIPGSKQEKWANAVSGIQNFTHRDVPAPPVLIVQVDQEEEDDESPKGKLWGQALLIGLIIVVLGGGIWWGVTAFLSRPPDPISMHFEGLKRVTNLRLVSHRYQQIIPFTDERKGKNPIQVLAEAPATVYGQMDMSKMRFQKEDGKLLKVVMPPPELSDVRIDLKEMKELLHKGNKLEIGINGNTKKYARSLGSILDNLAKAQDMVAQSAIQNGILEETNQRGRQFILNNALALGYRVEFEPVVDSLAWGGSEWKTRKDRLESILKTKYEGWPLKEEGEP